MGGESFSDARTGDRPAANRALFIVITDYPAGAERVTFSLASELASRPGWKVDVKIVCSQLPQSFSARVLPPTVRVTYGPAHNWYLAFPFLPLRLLFRRYDLVFTTHVYTNALLSMMRRLTLIHVGRLVVRESMSLFDRFTGLKALRFPLLYKAYGREDLVIAQTPYMAEHLRPFLPAKSASHFKVLANPVDSSAIAKASAEPLEPELRDRLAGATNILFCGRLVEFKRPGAAIEAFRIAASHRPDAQLLIMGAGELEPVLRLQADDAGLADRVLFLGNRTNPYPIMAASQVGLLTSANEGFPNVLLEMMACGIPNIITTPCADDLQSLDGVTVTRSHEINDIAATLRAAVDHGPGNRKNYSRALASRSVSAFVDSIGGREGAKTGTSS